MPKPLVLSRARTHGSCTSCSISTVFFAFHKRRYFIHLCVYVLCVVLRSSFLSMPLFDLMDGNGELELGSWLASACTWSWFSLPWPPFVFPRSLFLFCSLLKKEMQIYCAIDGSRNTRHHRRNLLDVMDRSMGTSPDLFTPSSFSSSFFFPSTVLQATVELGTRVHR